MTVKILWSDRNYDYVGSFIEATKSILPEVEFVIKDEPVDAIKEILTNHSQYKLVISGQIFKNMSGTDLFEILFTNKSQTPFLLLTAQVDYNQFSNYDQWYSFNYIDKLKVDFFDIAERVKELINCDISSTFELHEKLKDIRILAGISVPQMAKNLGVQEHEVNNAEMDYKKVSYNYLLKVSKYYNLDIKLLIQANREYLAQKLKSEESQFFKIG